MRHARRALRRKLVRSESGWALIELMVVVSLLGLVMAAVLTLLDTTARVAPRDQERAHAIREAQVGLHRMVRELRQAYGVNATTRNYIDVNVTIGDQGRRVVYDCDFPRCVRREGAVGPTVPSGSGEVVIARLLNGTPADPVFTFSPANRFPPDHVSARVRVPASGERSEGHRHNVVLDDGFALRNVTLGR